jgi:hypothetical protein
VAITGDEPVYYVRRRCPRWSEGAKQVIIDSLLRAPGMEKVKAQFDVQSEIDVLEKRLMEALFLAHSPETQAGGYRHQPTSYFNFEVEGENSFVSADTTRHYFEVVISRYDYQHSWLDTRFAEKEIWQKVKDMNRNW